ncbi:MAG: response regulator [Nitrospirae bacterium]|nr:response regulator [Nitrospirota bacterium]
MKILVVDDEQLVRWFLERALKKLGYDVFTVSNIKEALKNLEDNNFDLLITDLKMPYEGGASLIEKVHAMKKSLKIIVCSAFITPEMDNDFRDKGVQILKKPFKLDELENVISACGISA